MAHTAMKKLLFNILCAIAAIVASLPANAQIDTIPHDSLQRLLRYERRLERMQQRWQRLIPAYGKVQYAGNMGLLSFGVGWAYGRNKQWETDIFVGFLPKYDSDKAKVTMTFKQNFMPWKCRFNEMWHFEPLACGLYLNTVLHNDFWVHQPDRYPNGYYWFSTRIRTNVYIGQRITFKIPERRRFFARSITAFYEISTCDYYILSHIGNKGYSVCDLISLSFGIKMQIF